MEIFVWLVRNPFFFTNLAVLLLDNVFQCVCNLQHVSDININFGQHFFKISPNFCVWLDMDTIHQCPLQQCTKSLDSHLPHVMHCPLHHVWVNLGNLPKYIGIQLVDCGRAWAVDLRLEEAPEAEVGRGERSIPYSHKVIPNSADSVIVWMYSEKQQNS